MAKCNYDLIIGNLKDTLRLNSGLNLGPFLYQNDLKSITMDQVFQDDILDPNQKTGKISFQKYNYNDNLGDSQIVVKLKGMYENDPKFI